MRPGISFLTLYAALDSRVLALILLANMRWRREFDTERLGKPPILA